MQGSTTDHVFYICQVLEKQQEYNVTLHQLLIDFKMAYDSVKRDLHTTFSLSLVL